MHNKTLVLKDVWFKYRYQDDWALRGINLEANMGDFILITGPTGSGKTTLTYTISGLVPHYIDGEFKGEVYINGMRITKETFHELCLKVGSVWQNPENQIFGLTVEEEIVFGLENIGLPEEEIEKRLKWALKVVDMLDYLNKSPFELSGGQKQRVAIAAVLARRPQIMVLDEPTAELDPQGRAEIIKVIQELREREKITIIITEHRFEELVPYADRVILLENGEISMSDKPEKFFKDPDFLKERGVRPTQVTELFHEINKNKKISEKIPLTIDEAYEILSKIISITLEKNVNFQILKHERFPENTEPVIECSSLSFTYPDGTEALRDIDLRIDRGDFVAILGQNGSGKTTLIKHFNGLLKPTKGTIRVLGKDTKTMSVAELSRKVGYVAQNPDYQIFSRTVEEEVAFGPKNLGLSVKEIKDRVNEALEAIKITHLRNENPIFLSRSDKQKVVIASVLAMNPEILVLDEPTNALDYRESKILFDIIKRLNSQGRTIIIITHDMLWAAEYAEKVVIMSRGKIIGYGSPRQVFTKLDLLKQAALKPPQITELAIRLKEYGIPSGILSVAEMANILNRILT